MLGTLGEFRYNGCMNSNNNSSGTIIAVIAIVVMVLLAVVCVLVAAGWFLFAGANMPQPAAPMTPATTAPANLYGLPMEVTYPGATPELVMNEAVAEMEELDTSHFLDWKIVGRNERATIYLLLDPSGPTAEQLERRDEIVATIDPLLPVEANVQAGGDFPVELKLDEWDGQMQTRLKIRLDDVGHAMGITNSHFSEALRKADMPDTQDQAALEKVRKLTMETPSGRTVRLEEIAEITLEEEPAVVIYER